MYVCIVFCFFLLRLGVFKGWCIRLLQHCGHWLAHADGCKDTLFLFPTGFVVALSLGWVLLRSTAGYVETAFGWIIMRVINVYHAHDKFLSSAWDVLIMRMIIYRECFRICLRVLLLLCMLPFCLFRSALRMSSLCGGEAPCGWCVFAEGEKKKRKLPNSGTSVYDVCNRGCVSAVY